MRGKDGPHHGEEAEDQGAADGGEESAPVVPHGEVDRGDLDAEVTINIWSHHGMVDGHNLQLVTIFRWSQYLGVTNSILGGS